MLPERPFSRGAKGDGDISQASFTAVGARMDEPSQGLSSGPGGPEGVPVTAGLDTSESGRRAESGERGTADLEQEVRALRSELAQARASLWGLQELFQEAPAYVSVHDGPEHGIVFATALLERLLGGRRLRGLSFAEGFPPELQGDLRARFDAVYRSGYPSVQREVLWRVRDEVTGVVRELCADEVIQPWFSEQGEVRGVMWFAVDVMAQVKARRALLASERKLRTVVERAPVGIALISEEFCWQRLNDELCRILCCEPIQILSQHIRGVFFPEDWPSLEEDLRRLLRGEVAHVHREEQVLRFDGKTAWCRVSVSPLAAGDRQENGAGDGLVGGGLVGDEVAGGGLAGDGSAGDGGRAGEGRAGEGRAGARQSLSERQLVVIVDDVSERYEYRRRLEQEARRRDEFMATLGHELRNPLAALANAAELLRRTDERPNTLRISGVLERQTRQMRRMVDELLDVARIAKGKIQLQFTELDFVDLVRSVADDLVGAVEARGLTLQVDLPARELWVRGDRIRLTQIIQNLADNAAKFTDPPGRVVLRVTVDEDERRVRLSVCDTGCGMDPELLCSAFESFRQAHHTLGQSRGGLGLGLPLVRGLVTMHGGSIEARSDGPGCGTEMHVTLPLLEEPAERGDQRLATGVKSSLRVLVVEDHEDGAETLRELLESVAFRVCVAKDAAEALNRAESYGPELVLCDIGLPGAVDGYELARLLRARWGERLLLVALTGYGSGADRERAFAAGFDAHMTKPLDLDALLELTSARAGGDPVSSSRRIPGEP